MVTCCGAPADFFYYVRDGYLPRGSVEPNTNPRFAFKCAPVYKEHCWRCYCNDYGRKDGIIW